ncbi:5691_t:CDS:2 [Dentiscutata heterogama]|uniref:5691_t:CDS:1 n=1 Tax=Dentiscutata heterogama TaxID=1316150 RepID=A0ACA9JZ70_9GLOM|nr:5691_t:CDS:2 [Dentiscutata heterogama]
METTRKHKQAFLPSNSSRHRRRYFNYLQLMKNPLFRREDIKLDKLIKEKQAQLNRLRRKANEKRQKNVVRMQLKMIFPADIALENSGHDGGDPLFDLKQVLRKIRKGNMNVILEQDTDDGDVIEDQKLLKDKDEDSESHNEFLVVQQLTFQQQY